MLHILSTLGLQHDSCLSSVCHFAARNMLTILLGTPSAVRSNKAKL